MTIVADLCDFLEEFAPLVLAAEWDNVGLLVGDREQPVSRVMTCLTITPITAAEAIREQANLIVTHHPLPFKPLKRITTDVPAGRLLLELIRAGIAIHSPHTSFDSAALGINQQLAEGIGLTEIRPLEPTGDSPAPGAQRGGALASLAGAGRFGRFQRPLALSQIADRLKQFLKISGLHLVGDPQRSISSAAVACGSAGEFLDLAIRRGCELLITGETRLHTCYEADSREIALLLAGHYASERFGIDRLAATLGESFPNLTIWASRDESDPLTWI